MRTEIITEQEKEFKPFTVSITAETVQDARLLFHVCNYAGLRTLLIGDIPYWSGYYSKDFSSMIDRNMPTKVRKIIESQGHNI